MPKRRKREGRKGPRRGEALPIWERKFENLKFWNSENLKIRNSEIWKFWNCLQIEVGVFTTSFCEGKIWKFEILIFRNLKIWNFEILKKHYIFCFWNFFILFNIHFLVVCVWNFGRSRARSGRAARPGPAGRPGSRPKFQISVLRTSWRSGPKNLGGSPPLAPRWTSKFWVKSTGLGRNCVQMLQAGWAGLGWLGWLAGCGLKSTILLKDIL